MKKYVVTLTAEERDELTALITAGKAAAPKLAHARIRLKADTADGGPGWTDDRIAEAVEVGTACSPPPDERARWTLRLLADTLVELEVVAAVSTETVRRVMKKTRSSRT
jgi:hypothetical protein